jgi:hypothetical protein
LHGFTINRTRLGLEIDYSVSLTKLYTKIAMAYSAAGASQPLAFLSLAD